MLAYHGTTTWRIGKLARAIEADTLGFAGLFVTDSPELAARYANAQATGVVDPDATKPGPETAILTLDIPEDSTWHRREHSTSLDVCEAWVTTARIVAIDFHECDYPYCDCHKQREEIARYIR